LFQPERPAYTELDMPRRRRPVRPVRRPNFQSAPPAPTEPIDDDDDAPTFADEPAVQIPNGFGSGGPVETRSHWIGRDQRVQGRRLAQLRRSSGEDRGGPRSSATGMLPTFPTGTITSEIRQILITTGVMVAVLVVLAIVLR
jgi:hypothetical protein